MTIQHMVASALVTVAFAATGQAEAVSSAVEQAGDAATALTLPQATTPQQRLGDAVIRVGNAALVLADG